MEVSKTSKAKIIGVSGGKGGTGKTTVAINLAVSLAKRGYKVMIVDTDVDAPNVSTLLDTKTFNKKDVTGFVPEVNLSECIQCGKCAEVCLMHAVIAVPGRNPIFFHDLCNGCTACKIICPTNAIYDGKKVYGWTYESKYEVEKDNIIDIVIGELKPNEPRSTTVVHETKKRAAQLADQKDYDFIVVDVAPGAHCNVMSSVIDADLVLAVTETTPFGKHDLELILEIFKERNIKSGIVINRYGLVEGDGGISESAKKYNVEIIGKIPLDNRLIKSYVNMKPVVLSDPEAPSAKALDDLTERVLEVLECQK